jgi:hypothetical protein
MSKLFDILDTQPAQSEPTAEERVAAHWLAIADNIRRAMRDGVTAIAGDCQQLGRDPIVAAMPGVVARMLVARGVERADAEAAGAQAAKAFAGLMPLLAQLWVASSDGVPFPDMPAAPPPPRC